jgi:hypothetical protein
MLRGHRDLKVFQLAYKLAMEIFSESKSFPREERALLPDRPDSSIFQKRCGKHSGRVSETTVPKYVRQ